MADYNYDIYDDDEDNDLEEGSRYKQFEIREGIAFLIELTPELLLPLKELNFKSQLFEILSGINDLMSDLIITLPSTGVGIYFYNCDDSSVTRSMKIPGFSKLFSLNDLNVANMKTLNDIVQDDLNYTKAIGNNLVYKSSTNSEQLPLILNKILDELTRKTHYNNKKLIWFTNNDKPYKESSTKEHLWRIINDYESLNYYIEPVFLEKFNNPDQMDYIPFDMKLYQDIFLNTNYLNNQERESVSGEYNYNVYDGISKNTAKFQHTVLTNRIKASIFRLKEIRRIQFSCNLILGNEKSSNFGCSIKGYSLYTLEKIKKFTHVYTKGEYPKRIYADSKLINRSTNETITLDSSKDESLPELKEKSNIRKGYQLSGGDVLYLNLKQHNFLKNYTFDHEPSKGKESFQAKSEVNLDDDLDDDNQEVLSYSQPPYLKLLGFRSIPLFQPCYHSSSAIFVTPDLDNGLKSSSGYGFNNSFTTFSSLYQSCLKLKKYAIVFGCTKKNASPCLYSLYPTRTECSSRQIKGQREFPEGFLLVRMPWLEDIRSLPNNILTEQKYLLTDSDIPASVVENYKHLISNFLIDSYNPSEYPNPSLNYFYKVIKHNLLQIEISENLKDIAENDQMISKLVELRKELVEYDHLSVIHDLNNALNRFEEVDFQTTQPAKKAKIELSLDFKSISDAWEENQCRFMTVAQLRDFAKMHGIIKVGTRKADVIQNIISYWKSNKTE